MVEKDLRIIPSKTNLVINDTFIPDEMVTSAFTEVTNQAIVKFDVLSGRDLTAGLEPFIAIALNGLQTEISAILYPGQGSKQVTQFFSAAMLGLLTAYNQFDIPTKRTFYGSRASFTSVRIPEKLIKTAKTGKIKNILTIDDVVSTGETVNAIRENTENMATVLDEKDYDPYMRFSKPRIVSQPQIEWSVACWLRQQSAKTDGFNSYSSVVYRRRDGKVPTNSLSTLLSETQKGNSVRNNYARKYFTNAQALFGILQILQREL